jgi:uncharacterized protein involved in response to NO
MTTMTRVRAWQGPAVLGYGFRPFFLLAGVWAALAMALWLAALAGMALPSRMAPVDWHAHEMLYGYVPAVLAGFLLTAVPNWTGRLPVVGWPLLGLCLVWVAGRVSVAFSSHLPAALAAGLDLAFLALLALAVAREIAAGRNWRNLPVLSGVLVLGVGNLIFHLQAPGGAAAQGVGGRLGIAAAVALISLVGGRIVPSFSRNWLVRRGPPLPKPFGRFDGAALAAGLAALLAWTAAPQSRAAASLCLAAGALHALRLARWAGWRTGSEPLLLVLHLGYAFVPLGFALVGFAALRPDRLAPSAALHAWTAGAIGLMTLAVMTRAALGHTGRPLTAGPAVTAIYALALGAALARVASGAAPALLQPAAVLWIAAFAVFAARYFPILTRPRLGETPPG